MATKTLPWEIIVDILSRMGAKDLLRFRCVAKRWCSLIDGHDFIKRHLSRSSETRVFFEGSNDLYWVDPEALDSPQRLSFPMDIGTGKIVGGCNGLIALVNGDGDIAIWNPMTRKHRTLGNVQLKDSEIKNYPIFGIFELSLEGFGYDPVRDDYKVLRLVICHAAGRDRSSVIQVYSVKANAWRSVNDFPNHFWFGDRYGCLVGNALHWVVTRMSDASDSLLAFDLVSEAHREVPLPYIDRSVIQNSRMRLGNLRGSLCVSMMVDLKPLFGKSERVDMWVMKEYGVRESWTKLLSVAPPSAVSSFPFAEPVAYLKGGDRILLNLDDERFAVYDVKKKSLGNVRGPGIVPLVVTHVCGLSLVGVGGDGGESSEKRKKKGKKLKQQCNGNKSDDFLSKGFKLSF